MRAGFTLIELMVVVGIIGVLSGFVIVHLQDAREEARIVEALGKQRDLAVVTEFYFDDVGFYPPDVCRGDDPGYAVALPWNPDDPGPAHCLDDSTHPVDWQDTVLDRWDGPYFSTKTWPRLTPWNGKYDYNYWPNGAMRPGGCVVPSGIYIGIQGDYNDNNTLPQKAEERMIAKGVDDDGCLNGEAQLLLLSL